MSSCALGNDAVHVLSAMNGGVDKTVEDMNEHAEELQALDTTVVSPDGYDAPKQVSSAYDLTLFARSGLQKKDFREYASTVSAKFPGETKKDKKGKTSRKPFEIQNTNRLLAGDSDVGVYPGIAGVKNGYTTNAGYTFTGVAEQGGKVLLVTVMNPAKDEHNEVYKETSRLFDWGFKAAGKVEPVGELVPPKSAVQESPQPGSSASGEAGGTGKGAAGHAAGGGRPGSERRRRHRCRGRHHRRAAGPARGRRVPDQPEVAAAGPGPSPDAPVTSAPSFFSV